MKTPANVSLLSRQPQKAAPKGVVPTFVAHGKDLEDPASHRTAFVPRHLSTRGDKVDLELIQDLQRAELDAARERMRSTLAPLKRTSGADKTKVLAKELHDWISEAMRATGGNWTPPRSLMGKIVADSWVQGDPITYDDCYKMAMSQLERTKNATPHMVPDVARKTWEPSKTGR